MFSLRIVTVDHYMSSPKSGLDLTYSQFRGSQIRSVPVFRIFGSTPSGNKTCLHVHGVFPYILVPYSGDEDAGRLMYQLASSLDKAINVSQNSSHSSRQHVFKIVQVSGRPFYGYHTQDHQFFKIFFYNPLVVKRACDLLQNGAVCGTKFQIHEGHVPFTLQFFIDYNLYGMSFINLKSVVYRKDACPSGVVAGSLPKESCCELEADAVAVDILNRLTIEGELAVNPGLNAIWQEEKKRLKRDALEVSQRPEPPLVMSEILLREKLKDNLRFLGKCKTPLKENIPYPAETQRTLGSDILDASVLDTHSISSLFPARSNSEEEKAIVDEELVLSLTQNSMLSNSLDQSVLMALDDLAAQNEVTTAMSQQVEEDSILGSQMFLEQNMVGDDISDEELEALNLSFPQDIPSDNCSGSDSDEETGENFEENIPQLDGIGDFVKNNKSKRSKRKRKVLVENSATEVYPPSDAEEILLNDLKDNNCWPESGKQETLEEIFSDEEPYNSPINNFENSCESVNLDPINVDLINNSFETVLRGDPSFTTRDLASEDVIFQPVDDEVEVDNENKTSLSEEQSFQDNVNLCVKKYFADKTSDLDVVPSLNNSLSIVDHEKSDMLAISSEELLNTSQLDEILNEDLNKGLEIICEKSPQQEFEENWVRCGDTSKPFEAKEEDNLMTDEVFTTNDLYLCCNIEGSETILSEEDLKYNDPSKDTIFEEVDIKPLCENMYVNENHPPTIFTEEEQNNSPNKNKMYKIDCRSPKKSPNSKLCVKIFKKEKKKKKTDLKFYNSFDMTRKEIEIYCSQVGTLRSLSILPNVDIPQPMLWFPIREIMGTKPSKEKRKSKPKLSAIEKIMKKCKFSDKEISKMKNCKVRVIKLMDNEILEYLRHPVSHEGKSNNRKTTLDRSNSKQNNLKHAIIQHTSKHSESLSPFVSNVESEISLSDITIKQENCQEQSSADNYMRSPCSKEYPQTQSCEKSSPQKLSAKASLFQPQWKSCKLNNDCKEENECCQNNPLMLSVKVPLVQLKNIIPDSVHIQQSFVDKNIKKENDFKKLQGKDLQQKENKSKTKPLNFLKNKKNFNDLQKIDGVVTMDVNISCAKEASFVQNQRSSIKLDKECIVKVLPLSVDVISNKTQNSEHEVSQRTKQDGDSISETLNIVTNLNPLVKVEKLTTPFNSSDSIVPPDVEVQGVFKSKKQCSSYKNGLKSQNEKSSEKRKRSLRMYSLDGTVDSSSSDENLDEKLNTNKDSENLYCTPNKRRKPKTCRSPRNYAPLSIEIKKSPKTKLITKTEELVESIDAKRYQDEQNIVSAETDRMVISQGDSVESNRHEINQPTNILASVEKLEKCFFDKNDPIESCQPTTSTTSQPLVKRLKVCVKRMSLDIPGYSLGHKEVAKIRGRLHRSSSLPGMTE